MTAELTSITGVAPEIWRMRGGASTGISLQEVAAPIGGRPVFPYPPKIGLAIGTFGSVPYVRLHLEARRRFYPKVPVLVHDDGSPQRRELEQLCAEYGAEFESAARCSGHQRGDLLALIGGMIWAEERGIDLLVKMSRRFLPLMDWTAGLLKLALDSQYATFSSWTSSFNFGFRTECVGFAVRAWRELGLLDRMIGRFVSGAPLLVEEFVHELARQAAAHNCREAREFDQSSGGERHHDRNGYAVWEFMGCDRRAVSDQFLWHDSSPVGEYQEIARQWGVGSGDAAGFEVAGPTEKHPVP